MTIREAIKEQRKSIKNRSPQERISYFWEYYALKVFILVLVLGLVIAFAVTMLTQKDYALTCMFFGGLEQPAAEAYLEDFAKSAGIDTKKEALSVRPGPDIYMNEMMTPEIYQSMEAFTAMVAAGSVDCFAGNSQLFIYYAYMDYAVDLRTVLTEQELADLAPYLYYVDAYIIRQQQEADIADPNTTVQFPDPTKPEIMKEPIPVAISLEAASEDFQDAYKCIGTNLIGICASTQQKENALAFLRYIFA